MTLLGRLFLVSFFVLVVGCKADIVETKIKTNDLKKSMSGKTTDIPFSAAIQVLGDDKNTKSEIAKYESIIEKFIDVEDFEISKTMMGMEIKFEGNIPLVYGKKTNFNGKHPWALFIKKTTLKTLKGNYPYRLSLEPTHHFLSFKDKFSQLNILLSPDPHQPILMKIRNTDNSAFQVFTGSVQVRGNYYPCYEETIRKRTSLKMKGGVYEHTYPVIYFNIR